MSLLLLILYFLYPIVGLCTFYTLTRLRMFTARKFYVVAFFVLFAYLPICEGGDLLELALSFDSPAGYFTYMSRIFYDPFVWSGYLTYPIIIAMVMSAFMCISAIAVALTAAVSVVRKLFGKTPYARRIRARKVIYRACGWVFCLPVGRRLSELCRYNC